MCCYQSQSHKIWKQFTTKRPIYLSSKGVLSITKLQNFKAIHNAGVYAHTYWGVVINHKTTKFESNSQPVWSLPSGVAGCYQSQNYKISKQFTTGCACTPLPVRLLSITKLQKLKAIHNGFSYAHHRVCVVINHKTTKFERNSQRALPEANVRSGCYQSQNYKIWKQFTTLCQSWKCSSMLLSITKLQNLKAIHNCLCCY